MKTVALTGLSVVFAGVALVAGGGLEALTAGAVSATSFLLAIAP